MVVIPRCVYRHVSIFFYRSRSWEKLRVGVSEAFPQPSFNRASSSFLFLLSLALLQPFFTPLPFFLSSSQSLALPTSFSLPLLLSFSDSPSFSLLPSLFLYTSNLTYLCFSRTLLYFRTYSKLQALSSYLSLYLISRLSVSLSRSLARSGSRSFISPLFPDLFDPLLIFCCLLLLVSFYLRFSRFLLLSLPLSVTYTYTHMGECKYIYT